MKFLKFFFFKNFEKNLVQLLTVLIWFCSAFSSQVAYSLSTCPQGLEEWRHWQSVKIDEIIQSNFESSFGHSYGEYLECLKSFAQIGSQKICFNPFLEFTGQVYRERLPGHSLGSKIDDYQYIIEFGVKGLEHIPNDYFSAEFLKLLDSGDIKDLFKAMHLSKKIAAKYSLKQISFFYDSNLIRSVDDAQSYGRFFLGIKALKADIFLQYSIKAQPSSNEAHSISMIMSEKSEDKNSPPKYYFNDLWREKQEGKFYLTTRFAKNGRLENCGTCHKSALIPIVPDDRTFRKELFEADLAKANRWISQLEQGIRPGLYPDHYGPSIGVEKLISEYEIGECSQNKNLSKTEVRMIGESIQCQLCHDGHYKGRLNYPSGLPFQLENNKSLLEIFVTEHKTMPPDLISSNAIIRLAIFNCLMFDYYGKGGNKNRGKLVDYLLNDSCFDAKH